MPCDESTKVTENEGMRRVIFENAMKGEWVYVVNYCRRLPWLCGERVTRLGNAALHLAVSDGQERVVRHLIGIIESRWDPVKVVEILETKNVEGNTPLHLAVLRGDVTMCRCICYGRPQLVAALNEERETPLFLAARVGERDAFRCLLEQSSTREYVKVRNQKGDTILHCAISGEHWKLAFQILDEFPDLHNSKNEKGRAPLDVLAEKPGAFRSGTYLSLLDRLIYDNLIPPYDGDGRHKDITCPKATGSTTNVNDQDRHEAAHHIPEESDASNTLPPHMIDVLEKGHNKVEQDFTCDEDARKVACQTDPSCVPPNYYICFTFISYICFTFISPVVEMWRNWLKRRSWTLKGQNYIQKIKKKKEANLLSVQIMNRILELEKALDFNRGGWNPSIVLATNPFAAGSETKKETDSDGGLLDMSQLKTNEVGAPEDNHDKEMKTSEEGARKDNHDKEKKTSEEGSNWAVVFKLDKDEPRPDVVFVRGVVGDSVDTVTIACSAAKNLDEKLRKIKAQRKDEVGRVQTPILLAAKNGIKEMVKRIDKMDSIAIHDVDMDGKNAVLLAVENRQPEICKFLMKKYDKKSSLFRAVDKDGCSALHLAAKFSDKQSQFIPGAALQMQCEVLWFEYVKNFMMPKYYPSRNIFNETADEIFKDHHKELMEKGKEWLKSTSNSCSLVATIIATVVFTTAITVPGGARNDSGKPYLEDHAPFRIFAISSLVALCFSVTSTITFLAILTSRNQETDFGRNLPRKLLLGLTTLFISIVAILVNFCSSHFFVLQDELKRAALPVYAVTCLPATYFAAAQLPLYIDLLWATGSKVPPRWMKKDI